LRANDSSAKVILVVNRNIVEILVRKRDTASETSVPVFPKVLGEFLGEKWFF